MADDEGREDEDAYLYGEPVGDELKEQMTTAGATGEAQEMDTATGEQPSASRKRKLETDEEGGEEEGNGETLGEGEGVKEGQEGETPSGAGADEGKDGDGDEDGDGDAGSDDGSDNDDDDDDSDDDGVQVVIGDIKGGQSASAFGSTPQPIKRVGPPPDKKGKFSAEDFDLTGTINGVPAQDFSLDSLEDKPWRKPGADITDYFNYGFTEDTWRAYCDRQKRMRYESGATYPGLSKGPQQGGMDSKAGIEFPKKIQGGVRRDGMGMGMGMNQGGYRREEPRENTIQVRVVMTADRREYGRQKFDNMGPPMGPPPGFNMNLPPPGFPPPDFMGPEFFNHPPPGYYPDEEEPYDDQQQWMDSQWEMGMEGQGMGPSPSVVPLTKVAVVPPPPGESADGDSASDLPPVQKTERTDESK